MPMLPFFTNFTDMEVKDRPGFLKGGAVLCPVCKGYGGCVLTVDAYGKGKHFKGHCSQCHGYGWVKADSKNATCVHVWNEKNIGNCLHLWTCEKCGQSREVDSSD